MSTWINDHEAGESKPDVYQLTSCVSAKSNVCIDSLRLSVLSTRTLAAISMRKAGWWSVEMAVGSWKVRTDSALPRLKEESIKSLSLICFHNGKS